MNFTKDTLEAIYTKAFNEALEANKHRGWQLSDSNGKPFEDTGIGKFYLCGFAWIHYDCSTQKGRDAHKMFKKLGFDPRKNYYGGFDISLDSARGHTNGFFEIMVEGYEEVVNYLRINGYDVTLDTRLD